MSIMSDNKDALRWWRALNLNSQIQIHKESKHKHYSFLMFNASTQAIRTAYLSFHLGNKHVS